MPLAIRVFLVNPDQEATNELIEIMGNVEDIEVVGNAESSERTLHIIKEMLPNVVLVDDALPGGPYDLAAEITKRFANMAVIIIGDKPGAGEVDYRKIIQVGARDFVPKPVQPVDLVDSIYRAYELEKNRIVVMPPKTSEGTPARKTKVITVFSSKGGAGTTTIAVNLAVTLAKMLSGRTLLWDLDLYHGIGAIATNVVQRRHLTDMLNEIQYMDQDLFESYLERHESGLMVLPSPFTPEFADFVSADHVKKLLAVAREGWDYIIVDTPSILNETTVAAMQQSDLILLIGSLDMGTIKNNKAALVVMDKLGLSRARVKLVLNRVGREFGIYPKDIESTLKMPVYATIPSDANSVLSGLNQGVPAALNAPDSEFGRSIRMLAENLIGRQEPQPAVKEKRGFWHRKRTAKTEASR